MGDPLLVGAGNDIAATAVALSLLQAAVAQRRDALTRDGLGRNLHERLFAWVTLANDRNLAET